MVGGGEEVDDVLEFAREGVDADDREQRRQHREEDEEGEHPPDAVPKKMEEKTCMRRRYASPRR